MALITDPFFYAVAIPSVLLMGVSKSGFGTGFGSLAVPLMALAVSVPSKEKVQHGLHGQEVVWEECKKTKGNWHQWRNA